jgi:hypothetical protein
MTLRGFLQIEPAANEGKKSAAGFLLPAPFLRAR